MADLKEIQRSILISSYEAKGCHIGSALSCAPILWSLFYKKKIKPEQFFFAKASGVAAYYVILADLGYFDKDKIAGYLKNYPLPSKEVPGITHSFGSVGHGLSVAAGYAMGGDEEVYVLLSDGDLMEGSTHEAALFINQHDIDNLHVYVDDNKLVACGKTEDILAPDWDFYQANIQNFHRIETVKGQGVDFMEGKYEWHYRNLTSELLEKALSQI